MKQFNQLVRVLASQNCSAPLAKEKIDEEESGIVIGLDSDRMKYICEETRSFVLSDKVSTGEINYLMKSAFRANGFSGGKFIPERYEPSPFDYVSIEKSSGPLVSSDDADILCMLIMISQDEEVVFLLIDSVSIGMSVIFAGRDHLIFGLAVNEAIKLLRANKIGKRENTTPAFYRLKNSPKKRRKIINRHVYITTTQEHAKEKNFPGMKIDWSHKWEVRGHWRKVKGVGKDHKGEYSVDGFTWVTPHEKGKGELIKKQRIIDPRTDPQVPQQKAYRRVTSSPL